MKKKKVVSLCLSNFVTVSLSCVFLQCRQSKCVLNRAELFCRRSKDNTEKYELLTRFVLLPLGAADSRGEFRVTRQTVASAVPLSPVVRVTAVANALPAAGARQGQRGTLGKGRKRFKANVHSGEGIQRVYIRTNIISSNMTCLTSYVVVILGLYET